MSIALAIVAGIYLIGFVTMFVTIRNAPEGFQDDKRLNIVWQNHSPGLKNTTQIWS